MVEWDSPYQGPNSKQLTKATEYSICPKEEGREPSEQNKQGTNAVQKQENILDISVAKWGLSFEDKQF